MATKKIQGIKEDLVKALGTYHAIVHSAPEAEVRAASNTVRELRRLLSDAICEGADPCPTCGTSPIGLEQPKPKGGVEYELGCPVCPGVKVRGSLLPRHAVEAWNEGAQIVAAIKRAAVQPSSQEDEDGDEGPFA